MIDSHTPRILIARMSAVGDTILTLPVACALRRRFPRAFLGWVVERRSSGAVINHSCLDEVIVLERGWFTTPAGVLDARRRLRRSRFEIAIDCQGMSKTALASWLAGARIRIGYRGQHGRELSPWLNNVLLQPGRSHLTDRSLELLTPLGIAEPEVQWKFPVSPDERESSIQQMVLDGEFAVINPGASWPSRRWEMDRFAEVASQLGRRHRLPTVVIWGNDRELGWAREIVARANGHARLAPRTSLGELAALLQRARVFIGSDAGPLHLAVAVGTPCLSLHGITRPQDSGPYGSPHMSLQVEKNGSRRQHRKWADNELMRLITPEMVDRSCAELLQRTAGTSRAA